MPQNFAITSPGSSLCREGEGAQTLGKQGRAVRTLPAGSKAQPLLHRRRMGLKIAGLAAAQIRSEGWQRAQTRAAGTGLLPPPPCPAATPSWGRGRRCHRARGFVLPEGTWGGFGAADFSRLGALAQAPVFLQHPWRKFLNGKRGAGRLSRGWGGCPGRGQALVVPRGDTFSPSSRCVRSCQLIPELLGGPRRGGGAGAALLGVRDTWSHRPAQSVPRWPKSSTAAWDGTCKRQRGWGHLVTPGRAPGTLPVPRGAAGGLLPLSLSPSSPWQRARWRSGWQAPLPPANPRVHAASTC